MASWLSEGTEEGEEGIASSSMLPLQTERKVCLVFSLHTLRKGWVTGARSLAVTDIERGKTNELLISGHWGGGLT